MFFKRVLRQLSYRSTRIGIIFNLSLILVISMIVTLLIDAKVTFGEITIIKFLNSLYFTFFIVIFLLTVFSTSGEIIKSFQQYGLNYIKFIPKIWRIHERQVLFGLKVKRLSAMTQLIVCFSMIIISIIILSTNISWKHYLGVPILSLLSSYSLTLIFMFGKTPVILLLGVSSKNSIKVQSVLLKTFRRKIGYARSVVSLLDLESYINDSSIGIYNRGDTFRTSSDTWYQTVQELCQIVKIIVIDYSASSTLLKEELQWIINNKLNNKIIIFKTGKKPFPENFDIKNFKIVNNWQGLVHAINNRL